MSGLELRQRLKAEGSQLPVIFITAADDAIQTQATKAGCVACLHKPFAADSLISAINMAIGAGFRKKKWDCK
jgi:FixJ family two-component response regulator